MHRVRLLSVLSCASALSLIACSPEGGGPGGGGGGGGGGDAGPGGGGGETSQAQCTDGADNDGDGYGDCADPGCAVWTECGGTGRPDGSVRGDGGFEGCAEMPYVAAETFAPVDIIFVVDSSGSMSEEADLVQNNINSFAASISSSGIDYHVIMMTDPGFVTVPPPLGTDAMRYLFINQAVGSHNAFELILSRFPDYSSFLRAGAATHIVVVTDDESDMGETEFKTQMDTLLGHTFRFHSVASPDETRCMGFPPLEICVPGCEGPHGDAPDVGARYYRLAGLTGGTTFSICSERWDDLWTTLRESVLVSATLPCYYALPTPAGGETLNPDQVNVTYTPSSGTGTNLPRALDAARCTDSSGTGVAAWYYDNNDAPTQIILCPAACTLVEGGGEGASLNIVLGCETEMILI